MAASSVNTRKLKDSVAEYLQKNKLDKACETLEQLVKAEPKDMTHRLKLGDTYRRLGATDKAIESYQTAATFFADEGLLIKAIAAIKITLEIDPKNQIAQRELAKMNQRRFAKPTLESVGLKGKVPPAPSRPPPVAATVEEEPDDEAPAATSEPASPREIGLELPAEDDEPLELDDGRLLASRKGSSGLRSGAAPAQPRPAGPPPKKRGAFDLGSAADDSHEFDPSIGALDAGRVEPGALEEKELEEGELDEAELEEAELEELPADSILGADTGAKPPPARTATPPRRPAPSPAPRASALARPPPPPPEALDDEDEPLDLARGAARAAPPERFGRPAASSGVAHPIADLLISDTDEIELLSVSSDRELPAAEDAPAVGEGLEDLDRAFGALAPASGGVPVRPTPPKVALFDDLPQDAFVDLVNRLSYLRFRPPELIIREGDPGRSFFVIVEGKVRVFKSQKGGSEITLAHLSEGAFFGEMALLSGAPRTANVAAEEDTELLEVTDAVLREVVQKYPRVSVSLKKFYRQRLLNNVMAISPLFKDFDPAERKSIVDRFKMRQFAQGEVLITEGTPSDGLYVVLHGGVNVEKRAPNNQRVALARLKEGDLFGEMSLLTRKNANATVTALTNSIVLKLPRENFQELVVTHPQILELVSALTEQRKKATEAILHGQGPGVDGMAFV